MLPNSQKTTLRGSTLVKVQITAYSRLLPAGFGTWAFFAQKNSFKECQDRVFLDPPQITAPTAEYWISMSSDLFSCRTLLAVSKDRLMSSLDVTIFSP